MIPTRRALVLLATLLAPVVISLLLPAVPASAQTTGTTTTNAVASVVPTGVTHSDLPRSGPNLLINQINYADCVNDDVLSIPVTTMNASNYTLQAWINAQGADCSAASARSGTLISCWLVASVIPAANTTSTLVKIPVRAIVAGFTENLGLPGGGGVVTGTAGSGGTGGTDADAGVSGGGTSAGTGGTAGTDTGTSTGVTTSFSAPITPGIEACTQTASNIVSATAVTIGFYLIDAGTNTSVASSTLPLKFKLVGPQPPANVQAGIGGNLLVTSFDSSNLSADTTINTYNIYCDPAPGAASAVDAGLLDADAGAGTASDCSNAGSTILISGELPPTDSKYLCGTAQKTSETANASGLVDGVPYHVAVAAVDTYYNTGPLSDVACGVPQPINGFYKLYRAAGGQGGGGFCSFSMKREGSIGLALLALACGVVIRRRRKK